MRFDRGYEDKHVAVWNVTNKKKVSEINILEGHVAGVNCVSFSPCGNLLASWDYSGMLIIWSVQVKFKDKYFIYIFIYSTYINVVFRLGSGFGKIVQANQRLSLKTRF